MDILDYIVQGGGSGPEPEPEFERIEIVVDEDALWRERVATSRRVLSAAEKRPSVTFAHGPVCIVNFADWHLGADGTDYERLEREFRLVAETPGMYAGIVGDVLDNFIIGKLAVLNMHRSLPVTAEWVLVKKAFTMIASKLLWVVDGNHDQWTYRLSGIDYFREVVEQFRPDILYAQDELRPVVHVGQSETRFRVRHKWQGNSIYNPTHGIERAAKFDKAVDFDVGIGAHTHQGGYHREFNNGGRTGYAQLCGTFKLDDPHARREGFARPNEATGVATILDEQGLVLGTSNLRAAAAVMRLLYRSDDGGE